MNEYRIWQLTEYELLLKTLQDDPTGLNYRDGTLNTVLHRREQSVKGELQRAIYFSDFDGVNFNNPIIELTVQWQRDRNTKLLTSRTATRKYFNLDGTLGTHESVRKTFYTTKSAVLADMVRRSNILQSIITKGHDFDLSPKIVNLFRRLNVEFFNFEKTGDTSVIEAIRNTNTPWLQTDVGGITIKDYMLRELTV